VNLILAIPFPLRLVGLFVFGVCLGSLVNLAVYQLAWNRRSISPWSRPDPKAPPRRPDDRVPILGWLGLRREACIHGPGFWIRPLLVELLLGIGLAVLYWWEIAYLGLLDIPAGMPRHVPLSYQTTLHAQYFCHVVLIVPMLAASLIDADEKIIPDTITVPGTLFGLLAAAIYPWSLLPLVSLQGQNPSLGFLQIASPYAWPDWLNGVPHGISLAIGLGCWWLWCVALMRRTWYSRHGWRRAFQLMAARLQRDPSTRPILILGSIGTVFVAAVWIWGSAHWAGLLTALVGLAASGGLIWAVRIIGHATLGREAMGFGDVTLMAMIGTFLGWQACLIVFFLAPFAGLVIALLNLLLRHDREIPYGPFLCLATMVVLVRWASIWWEWALGIFALGIFVPLFIVGCLALMAPLLVLSRIIRLALVGVIHVVVPSDSSEEKTA
jgi:prepilin signal peptidase PulO-like enzyme (type II secretory pathway)